MPASRVLPGLYPGQLGPGGRCQRLERAAFSSCHRRVSDTTLWQTEAETVTA